MRNIEQIDFYPKYITRQPSGSFGVIKAARKIRKFKKENIDYTKYENFREFGISFTDYVDALADFDSINKYFDDVIQKTKYTKTLDPDYYIVYKMSTIYKIILNINNSENKEQKFYDELELPFFRNYVELILSGEKINIKLKVYNIKDKDKRYYFKTPYEFVEIIKSPLLTKKQKQRMINDTYNSCKKVQYSSLIIENLIKQENLIDMSLDDQRYLLSKFYEYHTSTKYKKLSMLGIHYV